LSITFEKRNAGFDEVALYVVADRRNGGKVAMKWRQGGDEVTAK
jgi:hypothetical protein